MVRVKQFADDLGISKNKAKNLINKGRSRKDGGSQILEKMMKPKKYGDGGSNVTKVNKDKLTKAQMGQFTNIVNASTSGKITPAEAEKKIRKMLTMKKKDGGATDFGMLSVKAGIDNNPNPTQADRIAGATKNMRGGGIAVQGLGFRGVR
jgi:hypothetical protein